MNVYAYVGVYNYVYVYDYVNVDVCDYVTLTSFFLPFFFRSSVLEEELSESPLPCKAIREIQTTNNT